VFCSIHPLKEGTGVPLVFLHGFLGCSADWKEVVSYLPSWPCFGVDLPGHGTSPFFPVFDFISPAPKFHLIGYSMGGRLALRYALDHPERIEQLFIASAHPGLATSEERKKRLENDARVAKELLELPIDEFLKRWYDQPLFKRYKPDLSMRRKQNILALASTLIHYSLGNQPILRVKNAVYIVGEKDERYRALHPEGILVMESGHVVHLENPKDFAQIIADKILSKGE